MVGNNRFDVVFNGCSCCCCVDDVHFIDLDVCSISLLGNVLHAMY